MSGAVPELRFPGFDGEWFPTTVGKIGPVSMCKRVMKGQTSSKGDVPFFKIGTFGKDADAFIDQELFNELREKYSYPNVGDILISAAGTIGRLVVFDGKPAYFQDSNIVWVSNDETRTLNSFLFYIFQNTRWTTEDTTIARLYNDILQGIKVVQPSLSEQKKIADSLGSIDAKLAALREKADGLRQFKTGLMQKLFSQELRFTQEDGSDYPDWDDKPFSEIAIRAGEQFDPRKENGKPRVIELEHLESGSGKILSSADIDGQISLKNRFRSGDVLFGKLRPYLRKFARPEFDGVCSSEIWVLRGRKGVSNGFLYVLVQSSLFGQMANISSGSKMPRADWKTIAGVDFPVPCPEEQEKIASALSALDAKIDAVTDQITHMETFKKGLLQKIFV